MSLTAYLAVFGAGIFTGMVVLAVAQKLSAGESLGVLDAFKRLFLLMKRKQAAEKTRSVHAGAGVSGQQKPIDPREQYLYDSVQAVKSILLILAANIHRTEKVASNSSLVLEDVKSAVSLVDLPADLNEAQTLLVKEVDQVISSNTALREELARSQAELAEQHNQIEDLRTAVRIDGLTQLANRTYFDEKLNEAVSYHKRYGGSLSLMMIDLDNFKDINDSFGHLAGDRILKGVALKIKASLRGSDFLARFGGDEYALILGNTDLKAAAEVAWKLCEEVRGSRFLLDDSTLTITISIGVACISGEDTGETLLGRADEALYRAKANGRNGVSVFEPVL